MDKGIVKYCVIIFVIIFTNEINGQNTDSLIYYRGQIISQEGKYPVALAHVIDLNRGRGVLADTTGYFEIWTSIGDTLNISAIGFDYFELEVKHKNDSLVTVYLQNRTYEIPEVSISYLGTYKQFEYKVVHLDLPEIKFNPEIYKLFKHVEPPPLVVQPVITSPASLIYVLFSKDAKDIKKYLVLEEESEVKDKVWLKYNEHIVRNITGLSLQECREFMGFCNFQDEYILSINDYNLYSEIVLRFEAFKKSNQDSLKIE